MKKKTYAGSFTFIKVIPVLLLVLSMSFAAFSCNNDNNKFQYYPSPHLTGVINTEVETMPEFPGGQEALIKFIVDNVKYPEAAKKKGIEGKVLVSFVVTKTGKIDKIKIQKSVNDLLDQEAVRVVSSMPNWIPGKNKGVAVDVEMTLPIAFKLS